MQGVQDPNARNCHGYRKFVKRTVLENPSYGYLVNDTIVIRYTIELVISSGGALSRTPGAAAIPRPPAIQVFTLVQASKLASRLVQHMVGTCGEVEPHCSLLQAEPAVRVAVNFTDGIQSYVMSPCLQGSWAAETWLAACWGCHRHSLCAGIPQIGRIPTERR